MWQTGSEGAEIFGERRAGKGIGFVAQAINKCYGESQDLRMRKPPYIFFGDVLAGTIFIVTEFKVIEAFCRQIQRQRDRNHAFQKRVIKTVFYYSVMGNPLMNLPN